MEQTTILIIGAGPSGLALGALLGRMNVKVCPVLSGGVVLCANG
jgi:2-polyprenyl-6-methoxyphenol hydroxylase-like FAD-dependent oxidoreductase